MGIEISSEFDVQTALPIDSRFVVADLTARDAIPALRRYEGLICYVESEETNYQLVGGIDDINWVELSGGGGGGGILTVADLTERDAIDPGDRYEGLIVYVASDQNNYQLVGGIDNGDWVLLYSEGGTGFFDVVTRIYAAGDTWTKPSGLLFVEVELVGGGGGSGKAEATSVSGAIVVSGSGGGGAYARKRVDAGDLSGTETVTVGAAGAAGTVSSGGDGGTSSFGTHCLAVGGIGGDGASRSTAGFTYAQGALGGNSASCVGDITLSGQSVPRTSFSQPNPTTIATPKGGDSYFGKGARGTIFTITASAGSTGAGASPLGNAYGAGASGAFAYRDASNVSANGAAGAPGLVIVKEYIMTGVWSGVSPVKTVADIPERDAIDSGDRFEGLVVYVVSEGKNYQLVGGITNGDWVIFGSGSGGGGGGSLELFAGDDPAPTEVVKYGIKCLEFETGADQHIMFSYQVPAGYIAGNQIKVFAKFFCEADDSDDVLLESETSLRSDGDILSVPSANVHASTGAAIEQDVVNEMEILELDLTDASGEINSVAVVPGDLLVVAITRGTDTAEEPVYLVKGSLEVRIG